MQLNIAILLVTINLRPLKCYPNKHYLFILVLETVEQDVKYAYESLQ